MNKKQWMALGLLFIFYAMIGSHSQEAMYELLTLLCIMAAVACWVLGWLEKEDWQ
jgi:hypothetical protein